MAEEDCALGKIWHGLPCWSRLVASVTEQIEATILVAPQPHELFESFILCYRGSQYYFSHRSLI